MSSDPVSRLAKARRRPSGCQSGQKFCVNPNLEIPGLELRHREAALVGRQFAAPEPRGLERKRLDAAIPRHPSQSALAVEATSGDIDECAIVRE